MSEISAACEVCEEKARVVDTSDHGNVVHWMCFRCSKFSANSSATSPIKNLNSQQRANLSGWIFEQNSLGSTPKLNREVVEKVIARPLPTISERIDLLLVEALKGQTRLGSEFYPIEPRFIAATFSQDIQEVQFLLEVLASKNMIKELQRGLTYRILYDGYTTIDMLSRKNKSTGKGFVAMSFDEALQGVYENGIQLGLIDAGYTPVRVDNIDHINRIDDEIIAQIKSAEFVVADFTGHRGGVYFEAGFALGLNLPVIWTCHKQDMKNLHLTFGNTTPSNGKSLMNSHLDCKTELKQR